LRKIVSILTLIIIFSSCSVFRKAEKSSVGGISADKTAISTEMLKSQNLTGSSFFIPKAEVEISSDDLKEKFIASIKYVPPGSYLISLRSRTGIEAARIFATPDTLLINDRFNRKLYYGEPEYLGLKFGIPLEALPVIFGDYIAGMNDVTGNCIGGKMNIESELKGLKLEYTVDCKKGKIVNAFQEGSLGNAVNEIQYDDFDREGDIFIPSMVRIRNTKLNAELIIRFGKIERPWDGSIDFIPGNRYDLKELR
jgi:hypothetical protein